MNPKAYVTALLEKAQANPDPSAYIPDPKVSPKEYIEELLKRAEAYRLANPGPGHD